MTDRPGKIIAEEEGFRSSCAICPAWVWWRRNNELEMIASLEKAGWMLYRGDWFCTACANDQKEIIKEIQIMSEPKRVGAVSHRKDGVVFVFGYGLLLGDLVPGDNPDIPIPVGAIAEMRNQQSPNPCIQLDSGQYVWGCECWWGPESQIKNMIDHLSASVTNLDIDAVRENQCRVAQAPDHSRSGDPDRETTDI